MGECDKRGHLWSHSDTMEGLITNILEHFQRADPGIISEHGCESKNKTNKQKLKEVLCKHRNLLSYYGKV